MLCGDRPYLTGSTLQFINFSKKFTENIISFPVICMLLKCFVLLCFVLFFFPLQPPPMELRKVKTKGEEEKFTTVGG